MILAEVDVQTGIIGIASLIVGGGMLTAFVTIVKFLVNRFLATSEKRDIEFNNRMAARDALIKQMNDEHVVARQKSRDMDGKIIEALTRTSDLHERVEGALQENSAELRMTRERNYGSPKVQT